MLRSNPSARWGSVRDSRGNLVTPYPFFAILEQNKSDKPFSGSHLLTQGTGGNRQLGLSTVAQPDIRVLDNTRL